MRRFIVVATLVLVASLALSPAASADPTGCFGPDPHHRPSCIPDTSDPTCIDWYFGIGEARICPEEWLP